MSRPVARLGQCVECNHAHVVDCGRLIVDLDPYQQANVYLVQDLDVAPEERRCWCGCISETRAMLSPSAVEVEYRRQKRLRRAV